MLTVLPCESDQNTYLLSMEISAFCAGHIRVGGFWNPATMVSKEWLIPVTLAKAGVHKHPTQKASRFCGNDRDIEITNQATASKAGIQYVRTSVYIVIQLPRLGIRVPFTVVSFH